MRAARDTHHLLLRLEEDMQQMYMAGIDNDFADLKHDMHETTETAHGRTECRRCDAVEIP